MSLKPYQDQALLEVTRLWQRYDSVCLCMPTGTGKTHTAAHGIAEWGGNILFLVDRKVTIPATAGRLQDLGVDAGMFSSEHRLGREEIRRVMVGTVQTWRTNKFFDPEIVVIDECHKTIFSHASVIGRKILGLTATPTGRDIRKKFQALYVAIGYGEAIEQGMILAPRILPAFEPDLAGVRTVAGDYDEAATGAIMGRLATNVVDSWEKYAGGKMTLVFGVNVGHAEKMRDGFRAKGISSEVITGGTPGAERDSIIRRWRNGMVKVLCNVGVFVEGYDAPECEVIVLAVPTQSETKFLQMCGRGCRASPGKTEYLLLDCGGNVFRHGSPALERDWYKRWDDLGIAADQKRGAGKRVGSRICRECFSTFLGTSCHECGALPKQREVISVDGVLREVDAYFLPIEADEPTREIRAKAFRKGAAMGYRPPKLQEWVADELAKEREYTVEGLRITVPKNHGLLW